MRVKTGNHERTVREMSEMWHWMTNNFGPPEAHSDKHKRWSYGKDSCGYMGTNHIDGTHDIEWFKFRDSKDAEWFMLRWS